MFHIRCVQQKDRYQKKHITRFGKVKRVADEAEQITKNQISNDSVF